MMKTKIAITIVSLIAVVVVALSFAACGGVAGTYKLEELSVTYKGEVYTAKAGGDLVVVDEVGETTSTFTYTIDEKACVFQFKSDGTYSIRIQLPVFSFQGVTTSDEHFEGKWEEADGKINILNDDGEVTATYTVENNRIVWEVEGLYKVTLKK